MVDFIEFDGIKYPVLLNIQAIAHTQYETGKSWDELNSALNNIFNHLYLIEPLLYYTIEQGHLFLKTSKNIKREEMPALLLNDKIFNDFITIIYKNRIPEDENKSQDESKKK